MRLSGVFLVLLMLGLAGCGYSATTGATATAAAAVKGTATDAPQARAVPWLPGDPRPTPRPCYPGGFGVRAIGPVDPDRPTSPPWAPKPCACNGYSGYAVLAIGPIPPNPRPTPCRP